MFDLLEKHIGERVEVIYYDEKGIHTITGTLKSFVKYNYIHLDHKFIPFMNMYMGIRQISSVNEFNDVKIYYLNEAITDDYGFKDHKEVLQKKAEIFGENFVKVYNLRHPHKPFKF